MNRILLADVILTLTAEQVSMLGTLLDLASVELDRAELHWPKHRAVVSVIREQCERQGVTL